MLINQSDPDHVLIVADQLQTLAEHRLVDKHGRVVEVFDLLGNVCSELLAESLGISIVVGSGEPLPESSDNRSDRGETFTFGNNEMD